MDVGRWYRVSGDQPDLDLNPTPPGTRYLEDTDPASDARLNPPYSAKERLRRTLGRPPLSPWHGRVGFSSITEAWNGAALASGFGPAGSMVLFGGGHADYYGSAVHAFDLASREWSRLTDGYVAGGVDDYGTGAVYPDSTYPDGSPLPPHTYDYVQYDPVGNDLLLFKGQTELGEHVKAIAIPHLFNFDSMSWRHGPKHPDAILNAAGCTCWDATRRVIWGHAGDEGGGNAFLAFSPDGEDNDHTFGTWGPRYSSKFPGHANHNCMQIDTSGRVILVINHALDSVFAIDPARPELPAVAVSEQGERPPLSPYASLEYSPGLGRFVYYSPDHGPHIYGLEYGNAAPTTDRSDNPTTYPCTWSRLDGPGHTLNPTTDAATSSRYPVHRSHSFGRFRIAEYDGVTLAVLVRHIDSPVYATRLAVD